MDIQNNTENQGEHKRRIPSYIQPRDPSVDRRFRPCPKRQVNLDRVIQEMCEEDASLNGLDNDIDLTESDDEESVETAEDNRVAVYLRLRPHPKTDPSTYAVNGNNLVVLSEETVNHFKKEVAEKHFSFTQVFGSDISQREIFDTCVRTHLNNATTDLGSTFLTYGTSGSGKTHTLMGNEVEPGIVPRAITHLFKLFGSFVSPIPLIKVERNEDEVRIMSDQAAQTELAISSYFVHHVNQAAKYDELDKIIQDQHLFEETIDPCISSINIWVSFIEIYNEVVRDLLDLENNNHNLRIIGNDGESFIKNVQWIYAPNASACQAILEFGQQRASYGTTAINDCSSRGHSVFYIKVVTVSTSNEVSFSNYKFCDLAGSERIKKADTQGNRLKETQRINKSLMNLGRCLSAVHANQKAKKVVEVVPVRDSKLTMLLQAALTGRERLTMIVNLLPVSEYFDENLNVLAFSSIAKQIHVRKVETRMAKRQSMTFSMSINGMMSPTRGRVNHVECELERERLQEEIDHYKDEIMQLRAQIYTKEIEIRQTVVNSYEELMQKQDIENKTKIEAGKKMIERQYQARLDILNAKYRSLETECDDLVGEIEEAQEKNKRLQEENEKLKEKLKMLEQNGH